MKRLERKVAVITGERQGGLGEGNARRFASEGARLVLNDLEEAAVRAVAAEIVAAGGEAVAILGDFAQEETWERLAQTALEAFGQVDILVNNAARLRRPRPARGIQ